MAGICDVTERVESPDLDLYKYREIIFVQDYIECANTVKERLNEVSTKIKSFGGIPVFCTICKSNIQRYNTYQRDEREFPTTSYLHHEDSYAIMQENLNSALNIINGYIKQLNKANDVSTPLLHNVLIRSRGRKGCYKVHDWSA